MSSIIFCDNNASRYLIYFVLCVNKRPTKKSRPGLFFPPLPNNGERTYIRGKNAYSSSFLIAFFSLSVVVGRTELYYWKYIQYRTHWGLLNDRAIEETNTVRVYRQKSAIKTKINNLGVRTVYWFCTSLVLVGGFWGKNKIECAKLGLIANAATMRCNSGIVNIDVCLV